ncbi:hypothetical protein BLOT_003991 [Blomia tropicalis]|nr:hypothetical protein BLOT_003991 [Blomia tropicalis]
MEKGDQSIDFQLSVRQMKPDEVAESVQMFSEAGLHDSPSTVEAFYQYDPKRFIVAVDEDKNQIVGCCAAPVTTHDTAFLGLYVVDKCYQRLGIGVKVFKQCISAVGDRNCGLGAVPAKFDIYKNRAGFNVEEGSSLVITQGIPKGIERLKTLDKLNNPKLQLRKLISVEYDEDLVQKIIAFDEQVHLDNRDKLLRYCLAKEDTVTYAVIDSDSNQVIGYGCIRPDSIDRAMPGPLYAMDDDIAEIILGQLLRCDSCFNDEVSFFTSSKSVGGLRLAKEVLNLTEAERCAKLYTRTIPPFNYDMQYACHTPDFAC